MPIGRVRANDWGTITLQLPVPGSLMLLDFEAMPIPGGQNPNWLELRNLNLDLAINLHTGWVIADGLQDGNPTRLFRIGGEDLFGIKVAMTCAQPWLRGDDDMDERIDNVGFLDALDIECHRDEG